ncbi:MAG: glutathione S-transferase family protein [Gammaproteobacteria bacterium]
MSNELTLVIGNQNYSSWSMRPWLLMQVCDIPFSVQRIPLDTPEFSREVSALSGAGRVPILLHDELRVWDSLAICEYLAELYPEKQLWPQDQYDRACARSIAAEMHSGFHDLREEMPMNCRAVGRSVDIGDALRADIQRVQDIWTRALDHSDGDFLFGEFCIADAMFAPVVSRFGTYGVGVTTIVSDYMRTIKALPAYQEWQRAAEAETETLPREERGQ